MNCVYFKFVLLLLLSAVVYLGKCDSDLKCLDSRSHKPHATPAEDLYGEVNFLNVKYLSEKCLIMVTFYNKVQKMEISKLL